LLVPVGRLEVKESHLAVGLGNGVVEAELALDRGDVGQNSAQRHDAALAAECLEQLVGDGLSRRHAVKGHVGHIIRVEVPGMQIVGLVPLGDDEATCLFHFFHDYPGVRRVIGIDVEDQFSAGALEKRPDIRDALFRVSFGGQRFIGSANGLGEIRAALGEAGVIGICHRAHGIGECPGGFLGNRRHGERTSEHAKRGSAFQNRAAVQAGIHVNGFSLLASHF